MSTSEPLLVSLVLVPGDPIAGCVLSPGRPTLAFSGWLELFTVIEARVGVPVADAPTPVEGKVHL